MMWSIVKIYIGIGFLAIYVHGNGWNIQQVIERGELIDGIFRPINESKISESMNGIVFQGVNMIDNRDVAMKFSPRIVESQREYDMYSYLNAIDNSEVEKYGISPIYYYNKCGDVSLTVFPRFECDLYEKKFQLSTPFQTIDYLILFRDFVRQSKYIHSCGIRHNDLKPNNIMFRKSRSFLIDFNFSSKMNETTTVYSLECASRRSHQELAEGSLRPEQLRIPLDDWESFLYTMAAVYDVKLDWLDLQIYQGYSDEMLCDTVGLKKKFTASTISQIERDVKCKHLKKVMVKFAREALKEDGSLPRYNHFDKLITDEIKDMFGNDQPAVFSWLKGHERDAAIEDLRNNPPASAEQIPDPKATYLETDYKIPDYNHFEKNRYAMASRAKGNHERYLKMKMTKNYKKLNISPN